MSLNTPTQAVTKETQIVPTETLQQALKREHRAIDGGIESYISGLAKGDNQPAPLITAVEGLRRHIYLEEAFLFPPLRETSMIAPIFVMLREHGELWKAMDAASVLLGKRADESADSETMLAACWDLLSKLDSHNSKEEPIIYPQADAALTASASAELAAFLEAGRMPDGWICAAAQ